jgi:hypothetical protein
LNARTKEKHYIMVDKPSNGLIVFRCCCSTVPGVLLIELFGVICGVIGVSILGFAMVEAPNARVWLLSLLRLGASLILGCV